MSYVRQGAFLPGVTTNFTTSGTSQATAAVGNLTAIVRVAVTAATYVAVGADPTAADTTMLIPAGGVELLATVPGVSKVAVLQVTEAGRASITQLAELP